LNADAQIRGSGSENLHVHSLNAASVQRQRFDRLEHAKIKYRYGQCTVNTVLLAPVIITMA
jgi:hypothetical protein